MTLDNVIRYYSQKLDEYGDSWQSLDWGSEYSQNLRFKVLAEIDNLEGLNILDYGCGLCHFYEFLRSMQINTKYSAVDICPGMVELSKKKYPQLNIELIDSEQADFNMPHYDYIFMSGVFTFFKSNNQVFEIISNLFSKSKKGLCFNVLSDKSENKVEGELTMNVSEVIEKCSGLTNRFILRHDYMPHDFTVYLYKQ